MSSAVVALLVSALFATVTAASDLRDWKLLFPVPETYRAHLTDSFAERRGKRPHEAVDILAPRNTPVRAVDNGRIAKLFYSEAGGNTIYQFDITERYAFYYAHLERYADGLNQLIRPHQHGWRDRQPERLGSLQVNDQLELGGLLDREVGGLGALQDLVDVAGSFALEFFDVRPVAHQPTHLRESAARFHRGQSNLESQLSDPDLRRARADERVGKDQQGLGLRGDRRERPGPFTWTRDVDELEPEPKGNRGSLSLFAE